MTPTDGRAAHLEKLLGGRYRVEAAAVDGHWANLFRRMERIEEHLGTGAFLAGYADRGEGRDYLLIADGAGEAMTIDARRPREMVLRNLAAMGGRSEP